MGDANSQYDAFGVLSGAISAQGIASPHIEAELAGEPFDDTTPSTVYRHPITGDLYERLSEGRIRLTTADGRVGVFNAQAGPLEAGLHNSDLHISSWFACRLTPVREAARHALGALPWYDGHTTPPVANR